MILPGTFLELTTLDINPQTKQPLKALVKPDTIMALATRTATGKNENGEDTTIEVTQVILVYGAQIVVMEPKHKIAESITQAFNEGLTQIRQLQNEKAILVPQTGLPLR